MVKSRRIWSGCYCVSLSSILDLASSLSLLAVGIQRSLAVADLGDWRCVIRAACHMPHATYLISHFALCDLIAGWPPLGGVHCPQPVPLASCQLQLQLQLQCQCQWQWLELKQKLTSRRGLAAGVASRGVVGCVRGIQAGSDINTVTSSRIVLVGNPVSRRPMSIPFIPPPPIVPSFHPIAVPFPVSVRRRSRCRRRAPAIRLWP